MVEAEGVKQLVLDGAVVDAACLVQRQRLAVAKPADVRVTAAYSCVHFTGILGEKAAKCTSGQLLKILRNNKTITRYPQHDTSPTTFHSGDDLCRMICSASFAKNCILHESHAKCCQFFSTITRNIFAHNYSICLPLHHQPKWNSKSVLFHCNKVRGMFLKTCVMQKKVFPLQLCETYLFPYGWKKNPHPTMQKHFIKKLHFFPQNRCFH